MTDILHTGFRLAIFQLQFNDGVWLDSEQFNNIWVS